MASFWIVELALGGEAGGELRLDGHHLNREEFFEWVWTALEGVQGVHEGTMLCEEAAEAGLETESWLVDSGEAPRNRDWIGARSEERPQIYFQTEQQALQAADRLSGVSGEVHGCRVLRTFEQPEQDWDAEWKKSFRGVDVPPDWEIVPPWEAESDRSQINSPAPRHRLVLNPGAGFGTGTHETTQLCLQALSEWIERGGECASVLDFGSGSGILAIGAAIRGASEVLAVEIDPLAIDNARENARLNRVEARVRFGLALKDVEGASVDQAHATAYDVVFANILKPVLLEFASTLCARVDPRGVLILSGLIEADVEPVLTAYAGLLPGRRHRVLSRNEWRAIVFSG